jgi:MinD-like ATPase involved in chromosome partitioning or flagellar assembly
VSAVICVAVSRIDRNPRLARQWPGSARVEPESGPYLAADPGAADGANAPRGHAAMLLLPKFCAVEGYRTRVSIDVVTNPRNAPSNSTEQSRQMRRESPVSRHQQESVSGTLRISDMVAPPKIPPGSGWRRLLYGVSFRTINLGESPAERHYRELQERIRRHIRKQYVIGVISGKGGVGKTTMTACIGAVFRECRPENVVAIDAAPGFGTLAGRIDESPPGDYTAVLNDTDFQGYADIREHLGQSGLGLDVLAGNRTSDQPRPLVPSMFAAVMSRLRRTHTVIVVDTSDDLEHPVMKSVFDACDTLVFVSGLTVDTSLPVMRSIDLLRSMGYHELISRSMVILNDSRNQYDPAARRYLTELFGKSGAAVEFMPYDPHLAKGGIIDTQHELKKKTRLRLFEITAALRDRDAH